MMLVEVDRNFIDAEPMKNRSDGAMIKAYEALWARLTASGTVKPKTHILDNEASAEFKREIEKNCAIQLVPPDNHRRNETSIMGSKCNQRIVLTNVARTLPRPSDLRQTNQKRKSSRHGILQDKIHHSTHPDSNRSA